MSNSNNNFKFYFKEILHFLTTRKFWTNFGGILLYFIILSFISSWLLKCYTKHGESLQVDDLQAFNYSVSHDLRRPITRLRHHLQLLNEESEINTKFLTSVQRLSSITNQIEVLIDETLSGRKFV